MYIQYAFSEGEKNFVDNQTSMEYNHELLKYGISVYQVDEKIEKSEIGYEAKNAMARSFLNKLSVERFDSVSAKLLEIIKDKYETKEDVEVLCEEMFDKELSDITFVSMYAKLCKSD